MGENLKLLSTFITVLAWIVFASALIAAAGQATWLLAYSQFSEQVWMLAVAGLASLVNSINFLIAAVLVLIWVYRAHANLRDSGLQGLKYSPIWASVSFLIPIANLFVPFFAMRQLANLSAGEEVGDANRSVDAVTSWWACHIGSWFFATLLGLVALVNGIPGVFVTTPFWANELLNVLALIMMAGSAFFLIKLVQQVTYDQLHGESVSATFE